MNKGILLPFSNRQTRLFEIPPGRFRSLERDFLCYNISMMILHEVLKYRKLESVWEAYRSIDELRRYVKLKRFRIQVTQGDYVLYLIEENQDRFLFWYTDKESFVKFRVMGL